MLHLRCLAGFWIRLIRLKIYELSPFLASTQLGYGDKYFYKDPISSIVQKMKFSIKDFFSKCDKNRRLNNERIKPESFRDPNLYVY